MHVYTYTHTSVHLSMHTHIKATHARTRAHTKTRCTMGLIKKTADLPLEQYNSFHACLVQGLFFILVICFYLYGCFA